MRIKRTQNRELQYMTKEEQFYKDLKEGSITLDEYEDLIKDLELIEQAKKESK
jgi:hypothetical protein